MAASQSVRPDWSSSSISDIDDARRELLPLDELSQRQDWRDDRLSALVAHKSKQGN